MTTRDKETRICPLSKHCIIHVLTARNMHLKAHIHKTGLSGDFGTELVELKSIAPIHEHLFTNVTVVQVRSSCDIYLHKYRRYFLSLRDSVRLTCGCTASAVPSALP